MTSTILLSAWGAWKAIYINEEIGKGSYEQ